MDPYIEAQKRLDRDETKCTIDTRLSADASKQCSQYMSTDLREVKEQILTMRQAQRLTGKLSALAEEMAALSPAGVIVMAAAEIEAFDPKKWMNEEVPARIAELEREIRSEGHDGQR